ncbi:juvenile hormone-binding protein-like isoform X2 [Cydia strobilella]|uniref:juvenile hormone-binding protein-like isoform X2 n=1 Tax=Cydia strobilella TaxID=1100964 RepID=UPI003005D17D
MAVFAVLMLLMFFGSVLSTDESIAVPCSINDIDCLGKSLEKFLEKTHKGIPAWNIVAIDPLVIPSFDVVFDNEGLIFKYKNLTVTGLRNQQLTGFKMDTNAKAVVLTTKADLDIVTDIDVIFSKSSKTLSGHYKSHASVLGTATYKYDLKTDEKGVTHFQVGPETITCKVVDAPRVELNPEFQQTLSNDADAKAFSQEKKHELREKAFCKITEKAYTYVVHNIREAAKAIPSTAFFTNIE